MNWFQKLLCANELHKWSEWGEPYRDPKYSALISQRQDRTCERCGEAEGRPFGKTITDPDWVRGQEERRQKAELEIEQRRAEREERERQKLDDMPLRSYKILRTDGTTRPTKAHRLTDLNTHSVLQRWDGEDWRITAIVPHRNIVVIQELNIVSQD